MCGVFYVQDVRVENSSCIFDTSAVPGGRTPRVQGRTGAAMYRDVLVENCSCVFDTSAILGGRMPVLQDDYRM